MARTKNPDWPHELAEALGSLAMSFGHADFVFGHLVGFAEQLDKPTLYREVLTLPPSEKVKRLRRHAGARSDEVGKLYLAICDRFEELVEDRNRFVHAYWYRVEGDREKFTFIDIHGKKDKLSKETHACTVDEVTVAGIACGVHVHNLLVLKGCDETAGFFEYFSPPEDLPIPNAVPRKVPFGYRNKAKDRKGEEGLLLPSAKAEDML